MNKHEITVFFNQLAPEWDAHLVTNDAVIAAILNAAGVTENSVVLDVACGTGVLFPYYLKRNVSRIIGVDISAEMVHRAAEKFHEVRLEVLCGDIETIPVHRQCDCCVVYNAFPHFEDPARLAARLAEWVHIGGRFTVAHGMSMEALHRHHAGRADSVSRKMLAPDELAEVFAPWFDVDVKISDSEKYIVSGVRTAKAAEKTRR